MSEAPPAFADRRHARQRELLRRQGRRGRDFALTAARKRIRWLDALAQTLPIVSGASLDGAAARRRILGLHRLREVLGRGLFPDLGEGDGERRARSDLALSVALAGLARDEELDEARAQALAPVLRDWLSFAVECLPRGLSGDGDRARALTEIRLSCLPDAMRFAALCERHAPGWPEGLGPPEQWLLSSSSAMAMEALGMRDVAEAAGAQAELAVMLRACGQAVLDAAFDMGFESAGAGVGPAGDDPPPPGDAANPGLAEFPRLRSALDSAPGGYGERSDPSRQAVLDRVEDCVMDSLPDGLAAPGAWEPLRGLGRALRRRLDRALADAWTLSMAEGVRQAVAEGRRLPALQPALEALREACAGAADCAIEPDAVRARAWERAQRMEGLVRLALSPDGSLR